MNKRLVIPQLARILLYGSFLLAGIRVQAQPTAGTLAVPKYEHDFTIPQLAEQLDHSKADTTKVQLLLKLSSIYHRKKGDWLDSSIFIARQAGQLSASLHFTEGHNEALFLECKSLTGKDNPAAAITLLRRTYGEERVRLLLVISEYYTYQEGGEKSDLNKAYPFLLEARKISDSVQSKYWRYQCLDFYGKYEFIRGNFSDGKNAFLRIITDCQQSGDPAQEALYWSELGRYMPQTDSSAPDKINNHHQAFDLYWKTGNRKDAAFELRDMSELNESIGKHDTAEAQMTRVFSILHSLDIQPSFNTWRISAEMYLQNGKYNRALADLLVADGMLRPQEENQKIQCAVIFGAIYNELGDIKKSLSYYQAALDYFIETDDPSKFNLCYNVVGCQLALHDNRSALALLTGFKTKNPAVLIEDKAMMAEISGQVYDSLHEEAQAERYYLQAVALNEKVSPERGREIDTRNIPPPAFGYQVLGSFYVRHHRFREAKPYLEKALSGTLFLSEQADIEYLLFRVDSAEGDYRAAFRHYAKNTALKDSMFNISKNRELEEMQVRYETKQNLQTIGLLQTQSQSKDVVVQKLGWQRNFTLAVVVLVISIAALLYTGYQRKQRSNRLLQIKQAEINGKNDALQELITDKDGLLKEKEWLLKEVHHRVKNNLQMMISLINIQSEYLTNAHAVEAVRNSSRRMYSMSLIHQKIYQSENISSIDMTVYIPELAAYLKESFDGRDQISYHIRTMPLHLDLDHFSKIHLRCCIRGGFH